MMAVLTVDDSASMRRLVRATLERGGYQVVEAASGHDALGVLEEIEPDLIITDLYMPEMDGLTLVGLLRADSRYRFTPVLLLTTESSEEMKERGRAVGATGWLVKPFRPEQLLQVVGRVMGGAGAHS